MSNNKKVTIEEIGTTIPMNTVIARAVGGIAPAIFLGYCCMVSGKVGTDDEFSHKTAADMERETTLTRRQQEAARTKLEKLGLLEEKLIKVNGAPTLCYRVNFEMIEDILQQYKSTKEEE